MTEAQIETIVCSRVNVLDRKFLSASMPQAEYEAKLKEIDTWADEQRKLIGLPPIATCGVHF